MCVGGGCVGEWYGVCVWEGDVLVSGMVCVCVGGGCVGEWYGVWERDVLVGCVTTLLAIGIVSSPYSDSVIV